MARLILSLDGQVLAEYNMSKERYTIGRLPDNDVRIDNPAVSGHHSLIINILNDSFLEDLNSTNGTYVNGKLIKKHALQHGDVITIGHHQLRFSDQHTNDTEQDEFEKTMVIPAGQQSADQLAKAEQAAEEAARASNKAASPPKEDAGAGVDQERAKFGRFFAGLVLVMQHRAVFIQCNYIAVWQLNIGLSNCPAVVEMNIVF